MSITLTVGAAVVELPADLYWSDELAWNAVEQTVQRSLTGALVVSTQARQGGRPISLEPPLAGVSAWMTRSDLEQLQDWANQPGLVLTLSIRDQSYQVVWRHQESPVIDATPVIFYADVALDDAYTAKLKFMEV